MALRLYIYGTAERSRNYHAAALSVGMTPVYERAPMDAAAYCDALLLTGGGDLSPKLYGEDDRSCVGIDHARDELEFALLDAFCAARKPIFGICRGLQCINVYFGGSLYQDIGAELRCRHKYMEGIGDNRHIVCCEPSSPLFSLYGREFPVNSAHHQAIRRIAPGFTLAATSDDGVIEAIACPEREILAVQWHPERMCGALRREDTVDGAALFSRFRDMIHKDPQR